VPPPLRPRWAASHAVAMDADTTQLLERKLHTKHVKRNLTDGYQNHHLGLDLPIGGFGNPTPPYKHFGRELWVGPAGVPYTLDENRDPRYLDRVQHGHMYLRWDDFGERGVPVLVPDNDGEEADEAETEQWVQLPTVKGLEDLRSILKNHRYSEQDFEPEIERLHSHLTVDRELVLLSTGRRLRCRGILIVLALEYEDDGEVKVLTHMSAKAAPDGLTGEDPPDPIIVEDCRMPMAPRLRHEAWGDSLMRYAQTHLELSLDSAEGLVDLCRSTESEEGTFCLYRCESPKTLCYQHGEYATDLKVDYDAYRFLVRVPPKDAKILGPVMRPRFSTTNEEQLHGFGGSSSSRGGAGSRFGTITREWQWLPKEEAVRRCVPGLVLPKKKFLVRRESGQLSALLLGIEGTAPMKESLFGGRHVGAKSHQLSAFGKRKWRDYRNGGQEVPADLGGIHVTVDQSSFLKLREVVKELMMKPPSAGYVEGPEQRVEKQLFRDLLSSTDNECAELIKIRLGIKTNFRTLGSKVMATYDRSQGSESFENVHESVQTLREAMQQALRVPVGTMQHVQTTMAEPLRTGLNKFRQRLTVPHEASQYEQEEAIVVAPASA